MTTIKSFNGKTELYIGGRDGSGRWIRIERGDNGAADRFPAADILAALGVDDLGCGCDEADTNLKKALARAEDAEAKLAEAERSLTELAPLRDERVIAWEAVAKHEAIQPCYDEDRPLLPAVLDRLGRLAEAEVTIERVRALAVKAKTTKQASTFTAYTNQVSAWFNELDAILSPFELPTSVPARIEAKRNGKTYTFYLWTNGAGGSNDLIWVDENDWTHSPSPARLMADFTGHRLIEAEA